MIERHFPVLVIVYETPTSFSRTIYWDEQKLEKHLQELRDQKHWFCLSYSTSQTEDTKTSLLPAPGSGVGTQ